MGGDSNPRCLLSTHAFQACTIDRSVTHPCWRAPACNSGRPRSSGERRVRASVAAVCDCRKGEHDASRAVLLGVHKARCRALELEAAKELVERELNTNVKLAEIGISRAHFVEAHLVNDRFNLIGVV